jgi:uncharacterized protein (DUF3820 family)
MATSFEYRLGTVVNFKKYQGQGKTVQWLIDNDLNYLKWLYRAGVEGKINFKLHLHARQEFFQKDDIAQGKEPSGFKKVNSKRRF